MATIELDVFNRTGLQRLKSVVEKAEIIADKAGKTSLILGVGCVGIDTYTAYKNKEDYMRQLVTGSVGAGAGVGLGLLGTEILGAYAIGALAGDLALGTTLLISCPVIGWFIGVSAGIVVAGYAANKASESAGYLWDEYSPAATKAISSFVENVRTNIGKAWTDTSDWILSFYGTEKK